MNKYHYDLHIHSCLSPCGDNDMTPNSIAGMGSLGGLQIMALTDHNTSKNCPAFFKAARRYGIIPIAGMELTTAEDIHVVCLFEELEAALEFDADLDSHRIKIPNRPDIFGEQLIVDENDEPIGTEDFLLINATDIDIGSVTGLMQGYNGFCYPAHVDRSSNGIISTLGSFPDDCNFTAAEFHNAENTKAYCENYPTLGKLMQIVSSDAHRLWDIKDAAEFFMLEDEPYSSSLVRKNLFTMLKNYKAGQSL